LLLLFDDVAVVIGIYGFACSATAAVIDDTNLNSWIGVGVVVVGNTSIKLLPMLLYLLPFDDQLVALV